MVKEQVMQRGMPMNDSKKRVVLVGPVYPYKGGISHYTSLMCRALSENYLVEMVSYRLQYPRFLFRKEQKDYSNDSFKIKRTTMAPWNWIECSKKIKQLKPDLIIIQWWHPYFTPCYLALACLLKRCRILFVCHNVLPHEHFPGDRFLTRMVLSRGNGFIVQSKKDAADLLQMIPEALYHQTVHPTYNAFKFSNITREESRKRLGIDSGYKVLLFFGFIREYKGLKHLIRALPAVVESCEQVKLLIVGDFGSDRESYLKLIDENSMANYIRICDGYIPDREVEPYFSACDLVILPYESATQSGIVQIAFGFEKPVVVTNVGGLPDVVQDGKTGYVVEAGNHTELAEAIIRYFKEGRAEEFTENVRKDAYRFSWDRMVEVVDKLDKMIDGGTGGCVY